ncbi:MAG: AI-2E family transporter [Planctomycetes bacterium]|nr:AI-2E family transporter [Planctomycetota bacterium]
MNRASILWRVLLTLLLISLILAVADLLVTAISILLLIFAGVLFGVFLNGVSGWLSRLSRLPYVASLGIIVGLLLILLVAGFYYLGSQIAQQATVLWSDLQSAGQNLLDRLAQYAWAESIVRDIRQGRFRMGGDGFAARLTTGVTWVVWGLTALLVVFFVGLYVAFDPDLYQSGLVRLVPKDHRQRWIAVFKQLHSALGSWIIGRLISMAVIAVSTMIGLWLLGVSYPIALGILAGLLTFIPNIGPILAAIPQALLALHVGTDTVIYVLVFNIGLQAMESYVITPLVQRFEVSLPPALTIVAQLAMGVVAGAIGIVTAAPLVVLGMVLVQMLYIRDGLVDESPGQLTDGA